ncbi:BED zinc finger [Ancylostoma duodenale]|uniref:BED zinc finger n=1 Tax=Ancylostoma duodenale TaxID=51022 RepID=A0A0C2H1S0_9BILA|nr:BED zinc finger [Ancylostoma duodenale]
MYIDFKRNQNMRISILRTSDYREQHRPSEAFVKIKTEHPVWEYFKRTADGNAQCGICTGVVKSPCSSNFMRHLMRHHSTEYNDVYVKWVQKRAPNK